jgi:hypothetical protein
MTEQSQLSRPMMPRSVGFDPDYARRQLLEERQGPRSRQTSLHYDRAFSIDAVYLKKRLGIPNPTQPS